MNWKFIDPTQIDPAVFDLSKIYACKVKKYHGTEDVRNIRVQGWNLFANLQETCPVFGSQLQESTWFLYAAQGQP